jgi:hypothetical protein
MDELKKLSTDKLVPLCERVETLCRGAIAGLTICDQQHTRIERALFPSLPPSFAAAITNVPLEPTEFGSCVKAIARREVITCGDIENNRFFDPQWRQVCLDHGLKVIQSRPIFVHGKPRGTFVLAFKEVRLESDWDAALMMFAADAAGEALLT